MGPITGGCFNPAVGLAVTYWAMIAQEGQTTYMKYLASYLVGTLLGGVVAGLVTRFC